MYCKLCHKNVRSISHWTREHRKYLASKARKAHRRRPAEHRKGSHGHGSHEGRDVLGHFCPMCGKKCG